MYFILPILLHAISRGELLALSVKLSRHTSFVTKNSHCMTKYSQCMTKYSHCIVHSCQSLINEVLPGQWIDWWPTVIYWNYFIFGDTNACYVIFSRILCKVQFLYAKSWEYVMILNECWIDRHEFNVVCMEVYLWWQVGPSF